jgi:hypothetical protein
VNETSHCTICNKPTEQMACSHCEHRMHTQLSEILQFVALAETNLVPGSGAGGRSTERPLGIRVDALDLVAGFDVLPQLESWERLFREDYQLAKYGEISGKRAQVVVVTMPAHDGRSIPFCNNSCPEFVNTPPWTNSPPNYANSTGKPKQHQGKAPAPVGQSPAPVTWMMRNAATNYESTVKTLTGMSPAAVAKQRGKPNACYSWQHRVPPVPFGLTLKPSHACTTSASAHSNAGRKTAKSSVNEAATTSVTFNKPLAHEHQHQNH